MSIKGTHIETGTCFLCYNSCFDYRAGDLPRRVSALWQVEPRGLPRGCCDIVGGAVREAAENAVDIM